MADRIRNAQRHERLKELLTQKVEKMLISTNPTERKAAVLSDTQRDFVNQELDLMLHSGDASEKSISRLVAQLRVLTTSGDAAKNQQKYYVNAKSDDGSQVSGAHKKHRHARSDNGSKVSSVRPSPSQIANLAVKGPSPGLQAAKSSNNNKHSKQFVEASIMAHSPSRKDQLSALHDHDMWAKMCAKDQENFFREKQMEKKVGKEKAEEQRLYLDQQVALRKNKKQTVVQEERLFVQHEMQQLEIWKAQEEKEVARKKSRFDEERKARDEQLDLARARKHEEAEVLRLVDVEQAKKSQTEYAKEQKMIEVKKLKTKDEVAKFHEYNSQFQDSRKNQLEKERSMDREHQRLFLERLEKQEQEREDALLKMHERQKRQFVMASKIQGSQAEKSRTDEDKAAVYLARTEAKNDATKKAKLDKEKDEKVKLKQYLTLQMLAKEKDAAERRAQLEDQKVQVKMEMEESERREAQRRVKEKQKSLRHRAEIEDQIREHAQRRNVIMTETEMRLNAGKIQ